MTTISIPPLPPARGYEGKGTAEVAPRYEDVTQDGRVVLTSLMPGVGFAVWRELLSKMPALDTFRANGGRQIGVQDLDGDAPLVAHVGREEHGRHAAATELALDRVPVGNC